MRTYDTVSFLSDYGTTDEFVGVVKSVIRDIAPHATVIDLTHEIPPHDVRAGSLALARCIQYVASGVVLAVVDPGVGGPRRALALRSRDGRRFVGPDNGLLSCVLPLDRRPERPGRVASPDGVTAVAIRPPPERAVAPTFHGRDVFAAAAGDLAGRLWEHAFRQPGGTPDPAG